jgi:hypothetical protein
LPAGISEASVPAELFPQYCTIEYSLPRLGAQSPPAYVFVLDTCVPEDELLAAKTAIQQALTMVPEYAQVGGWGGVEGGWRRAAAVGSRRSQRSVMGAGWCGGKGGGGKDLHACETVRDEAAGANGVWQGVITTRW